MPGAECTHEITLSKCRSRWNCVAESMKSGKVTVGLHQHAFLDNPCTYGTCRKAMGLGPTMRVGHELLPFLSCHPCGPEGSMGPWMGLREKVKGEGSPLCSRERSLSSFWCSQGMRVSAKFKLVGKNPTVICTSKTHEGHYPNSIIATCLDIMTNPNKDTAAQGQFICTTKSS